AISPDGRSIAFDLLGHIYEMPIEGGTAKRLTDGRSWNLSPQYSPDGRQLAFASDRSGHFDIWTMDRHGGSLRNLPNAGAQQNVYRPVWAPDGRRIYAITEGDGEANRLLAIDLLGGTRILLGEGGGPGSAGLGGVVPEPNGAGLLVERYGAPVYGF